MFLRMMTLAMAVLLPQLAAAQSYPPRRSYPPPAPYAEGDYSDSSTCVPMCEQDFAPCDPYYFKRADQRCNVNPGRGGRHHW